MSKPSVEVVQRVIQCRDGSDMQLRKLFTETGRFLPMTVP